MAAEGARKLVFSPFPKEVVAMGTPAIEQSILVVDDYPPHLVAIEAMLEDLAVRVLSATTGEQALALAETTPLALVVLDVNLPTISGFAVARRLRAMPQHARTPILFVTGQDPDPVLVASSTGLGSGFMSKPLDAREFWSAVDSLLRAQAAESGGSP